MGVGTRPGHSIVSRLFFRRQQGAMLRFWGLCLLALGLVTLATGFSEEQNIAKLGLSDVSKGDLGGNVKNIPDISDNRTKRRSIKKEINKKKKNMKKEKKKKKTERKKKTGKG